MSAYLFTKEELTFLTSLVAQDGCLPEGFCSYAVSTDNNKNIEALYRKKYIIQKEPIVVDRVMAFILTRLAHYDRYSIRSQGKYTVCFSEDILIVLTEDMHTKNGIKLIPLKNEDELEKFLEENGTE